GARARPGFGGRRTRLVRGVGAGLGTGGHVNAPCGERTSAPAAGVQCLIRSPRTQVGSRNSTPPTPAGVGGVLLRRTYGGGPSGFPRKRPASTSVPVGTHDRSPSIPSAGGTPTGCRIAVAEAGDSTQLAFALDGSGQPVRRA